MPGQSTAIAAKGLTGTGYDGHAFWDTETFVLPVLTYTAPRGRRATRCAGGTRCSTRRASARQPAGACGGGLSRGGRSPDQECSGYWPAGTAAFHVNADIADAVVRYQAATGDEDSSARSGLELLVRDGAAVALARTPRRRTGASASTASPAPTNTRAVADNNVYTNLMAQQNLRRGRGRAASVTRRRGTRLGVDARGDQRAGATRPRRWSSPTTTSSAFTRRLRASPTTSAGTSTQTPAEQYPLLLHFPYFDLYRKQVVKQADLVLAMHLRGEAFTAEQKARNFAYYEALTVRDSSLSACTQAVLAAEVGHLDLAYDYLGEAALMDLDDLDGRRRRRAGERRRYRSELGGPPDRPAVLAPRGMGHGARRRHHRPPPSTRSPPR